MALSESTQAIHLHRKERMRMAQSFYSSEWLDRYRNTQAGLLADEPDFAAWLDQEYVPIAGAWLY